MDPCFCWKVQAVRDWTDPCSNLIRTGELGCQLRFWTITNDDRCALVQAELDPIPNRKMDVVVVSIVLLLHVTLSLNQAIMNLC
jgi:hypothetical protein